MGADAPRFWPQWIWAWAIFLFCLAVLVVVKVWIDSEYRLSEQTAQRQNEAAAERLNERRGQLASHFITYRGWNWTDLEQALGLELLDVDETEYQRIGRRFFVDLSGETVRVAAVVDEPLTVWLVFHMDQLYQVNIEQTQWRPVPRSNWRGAWRLSESLREGSSFALSMFMWAAPLMLIVGTMRRSLAGHLMIASGVIVILAVQLGYQRAGIFMIIGLCQASLGLALVWWPSRQAHGSVEPVCERCGYNLTGNVSGRCPECGTFIPPQLRRRIGLVKTGDV